jgi:hypothetical protein
MSRKDAVVLASRTLALFFVVSTLAEASYLPEYLHSFHYYINQGGVVIDGSSVLEPLLSNSGWLSRYENGRLLLDRQVAL